MSMPAYSVCISALISIGVCVSHVMASPSKVCNPAGFVTIWQASCLLQCQMSYTGLSKCQHCTLHCKAKHVLKWQLLCVNDYQLLVGLIKSTIKPHLLCHDIHRLSRINTFPSQSTQISMAANPRLLATPNPQLIVSYFLIPSCASASYQPVNVRPDRRAPCWRLAFGDLSILFNGWSYVSCSRGPIAGTYLCLEFFLKLRPSWVHISVSSLICLGRDLLAT